MRRDCDYFEFRNIFCDLNIQDLKEVPAGNCTRSKVKRSNKFQYCDGQIWVVWVWTGLDVVGNRRNAE